MCKIWVGKRESDILTYNYFDYSITFYGSNVGNNKSFCIQHRINSSYSQDYISFILKNLKEILSDKKNYEIHFYNNVLAYKVVNLFPEIEKYIVNLNALSVLNSLRHKTLSRLWLCNCIDTPAFCLLSKKECTISNLKKKFGSQYTSFVIQKNYSAGGTGTYLMCDNNQYEIADKLDEIELYLASPFYHPNQSYSCHAMIDNEKCVIFPISRQNFYTENNKLEYIGNTYIDIHSKLSVNIKNSATKICKKLQSIGYRGICGFDFISTNHRILLVEINPRYQGSSFVINASLHDNRLPSLFELNNMCFTNGIPNEFAFRIENLKIKYYNSSLNYQNASDIKKAKYIIDSSENIIFLDGFLSAKSFEKGSYLLRYISPCEEF
ncbi:ATP-grasp domain-containing protein [Eubacterium coprostanoligenes]|uniref:ATP-grasp domain-containing protein n=1 Tax=Eubacterium coprostanoligenes TaxID=290054 RepID=UPI0023543124|nr:ATP-grasp domain-containing protein [Eubacterium coprostanoligenes]MCI6254022.1 ATP-grasp domain-containing protein [Eubacterium coprostanoligenes]MDY5399854.1 ATP-grasp domain-containing protein [Eubacterium coprostanoligenes]